MPDSSVGRRGVLASAAALAGLVGLGAVSSLAAAPAAAAAEQRRNAASNYHGSPSAFEPMIIEGGTLIDPATGDAIQDAVVVLDRGRVLAAGSRDATSRAVRSVAATARRIDAGGRFILPGLVDAHVHNNTLEDARLVLSHGATTVRSGSSSFYQDIALAALPEWAPGLAPRMHAAGLFVSPQLGDSVLADPALVPLAGLKQGLHDPRDLAYLTRVNIERGANVIKTRANPRAGMAEQDPLELVYDREQLASIVAAARGAGVLCHAYSAEGIAGAVAAGVRSIEHGVFVSERTLAQMARRGTYFTSTLTGVADMSGSSNPVLAERGREYTPVLQAAIRAAAEAGVRVVAGTDAFGTDVIPIGTEAWILQEAGLTALQALQSVTTNAASLLGMEGEVGRLVRGALPDVVLLEANPLESAAALERVSTIIAQGRVVGEE
ncbi:amidohydrolase family protein [Paeniglutamicibacter sp. ZC-3]|uniref:amidohydrolase family protein n=1 Tax=Paeniglutamicibacter sp. ZC-3 TaxID=2986919 RepID=UPI0021F73BCD|nr:amidohydrolase family protein [Paeniglutamicibacter sp. ZC-3]MCV9993434.1 amidohydrolase family protein [Paeniglutamicibacter sp. ZC-3]